MYVRRLCIWYMGITDNKIEKCQVLVDGISSLLKENDLICFESESEGCSVLSNSLQPHGLYGP